MAILKTSFFSQSLIREVQISVILPIDGMMGMPPRPERKFKTLYLLHGYSGANSDWLHNSKIVELAQMLDIAVVMPSGENSFYVDQISPTARYSTFIGEELVYVTRRMLPLSRERDDTFIAGLSMGGYGAIYNGLKHFKTFGHIIALSAALIGEEIKASDETPNNLGTNRAYFEAVFGNLDDFDNTDKNVNLLAEQTLAAAKTAGLPLDLYIACGWNDFLLLPNRDFIAHLKAIGFAHTYDEGAGTHDFAFWDEYLKKGITHILPLPVMDVKPPYWIEKPED